MEAKDELIQILEDTKKWASCAHNIDTSRIYSNWSSQTELLTQLDEHIGNAQNKTADFSKLVRLYAPTAGLCEILTSDISTKTYMKLAERFDLWHSSVRSK